MYRIGIDLGGTNVAVGIVNKNHKIVHKVSIPTPKKASADKITDTMAQAVNLALDEAKINIDEIESFGIGSPGSVDPINGVVIYANNINMLDTPICNMMEQRIGKKFYVENDANAAAYGEYIAGAGVGTKNFVAITLGTGLGGGIIIDGKIYSGSNHAGGELGHTVIQMHGEKCTCGRNGCWEAYASATALINQTKQAMCRYPDSAMWRLCGNDIEKVDGKTAFDAMRANDIAGIMVVEHYCEYVGVGIANIINTFQPEMICIGGGISKEKENLTVPIVRFINGENYARRIPNGVQVKTAALGNDAGIIGAAYIVDLYR